MKTITYHTLLMKIERGELFDFVSDNYWKMEKKQATTILKEYDYIVYSFLENNVSLNNKKALDYYFYQHMKEIWEDELEYETKVEAVSKFVNRMISRGFTKEDMENDYVLENYRWKGVLDNLTDEEVLTIVEDECDMTEKVKFLAVK